MSKRRTYITIILTVGSLAWTMYSLPDTLTSIDAAKPGSHASLTGHKGSNAFQTLPDVEQALGLIRQSETRARGETDEDGFLVFAPDADSLEELAAAAARHAPHKDRRH